MGKEKAKTIVILDRSSSSSDPDPVCKRNISGIITRSVAREKRGAQETGFEIPSDTCPYHKRLKGIADQRSTNDIQLTKIDTNLFESYLENLWRNISEEKRRSCTYLDCLWFGLYRKESAKTKVVMWIKQKHIFSRKYVFVPIICWRHWSLLILCHFGENFQSETGTPCMLLLDSLPMTNPKRLEPDIRKFVLDIYRSEGREEKKELISKIPLLIPKVPQQRNGEECGFFVLYFISLFLQNAPENFSILKGYPYFMKEDWFDFKGLESFYNQIHSLAAEGD